jgi:hypothetical protein
MKLRTTIAAAFAVFLSWTQAFGQATILPPGETCFQATTGVNGMVGNLGTITGGTSYTAGTYGGVALTGGSGTLATANITVSGGAVTAVTILNPGINYVVGDVLSASAATIGGTGSGFSVPVNSISINSAVAGGTVGFYIPSTLTFKQTWQNSAETVLNTNPVTLDQNGCALIYGAGIYRQILKDSLGNTVWDQLTASTSNGGQGGVFWAAQAGGTPNAITVVDTSFANVDGSIIQFLAKSENTGPTTIAVSGGTPIAIVKDTSTGPAALSGGEIGPNNVPMLTYDATNVEFHLVNPSATSSSVASTSLITPQGYLNLVGQATGDVVQTADVTAATTIFYSPFVGSIVPIWNGSTYVNMSFSELTMTLTAAGSPSNTIQDACVFSNNGVPTLVLGPSWTTVTAGGGNRGTGAGTAQLTRQTGLWVNAVQIIGYNGLSSFTIAANQCTYVGSVYIDATAGQVSAYKSYGQSRKWGIWNAYNRQPIYVREGDPNGTWSYASATVRQSRGDATNFITVFQGLPEESYLLNTFQKMNCTSTTGQGCTTSSGVCVNVTNAYSGTVGIAGGAITGATLTSNGESVSQYSLTPSIGINTINFCESVPVNTSTTINFLGTEANMLLSAQWRG